VANENPPSDIATIIRDLKKRRAELDASIASLERAYGATPRTGEDGPAAFNAGDQHPTELPRGAFLGKSLPSAIKLYLSAMKMKQTDREIATALREGGVESTSDNFEKVVTGCLNRMKASGEVLRFKDGWGLTEFYPESLRFRLGQEGPAKGKTTKKKKKKAKKLGVAPEQSREIPAKPGPSEGIERRIEQYFRSRSGEWISYKEVADAHPDTKASVIVLMMGKMAKKLGWIKGPDARYRDPK
jgi:hypothetical protein